MVKMPSSMSFLFGCGEFENVDHSWVTADLSLVGRLSRLCDEQSAAILGAKGRTDLLQLAIDILIGHLLVSDAELPTESRGDHIEGLSL